uniref:Metalloproteinase inhibitor 2 n=1 Tax=Cyprinus carpio TaxID=7962 RepID=A0A8C2G4A6_CYPCA
MKSVRSCIGTLVVLVLFRVGEIAEACSCSPVHPQQAFCNADVVIRAKVVGKKEVDSGNDIYGNPIKRIQYEIKQIKMFKGPDRHIDVVFTAPSSAVCGVTNLDTNGKKEYLISGKRLSFHYRCCFWSNNCTRYEMGCDCKITRCATFPCEISAPEECLWTDWVTEKIIHGRQSDHYACIKRGDGSCAWYRGAAPPKKEFLDVEDP